MREGYEELIGLLDLSRKIVVRIQETQIGAMAGEEGWMDTELRAKEFDKMAWKIF